MVAWHAQLGQQGVAGAAAQTGGGRALTSPSSSLFLFLSLSLEGSSRGSVSFLFIVLV